VLDILAAGGLVGLGAYVFLFLSAMRLGLTSLGLSGHRPREARLLAAFSLGGGFLAGVAAWVLAGTPAFVPLAFGFGLVAGLCLYLLACSLSHTSGPGGKGEDRQFLVAGLLAALVGHLAALQFSFGLTVSRTVFWMYLALLTALATQAEDAPLSAPPSGHGRRKRRRPTPDAGEPGPAALLESVGEDWLARSLLLGLILGVVLADFLLPQTDLLNPTLLGLVGLTWVGGGVLILAGATNGLKLDRSGIIWLGLSLGWALLVPILLALPRLGRGFYPIMFYLLFLAWLGLTLAGLAVALSRMESGRLPLWRSGRWPWYLGLTLVVGLIIFLANINAARADIYFKAAQLLRDDGRLDASIAFHHQALALAPDQDSYYASLALTYLEQVRVAPDASQRASIMGEALQAMRQATKLAPLDAVHFWNLGLLYRSVAEGTADPTRYQTWSEQALSALHQAIALEPNWATLYVEQGRVYLAQEQYEQAVETSQQALARDERSAEAYALLGDAYLGLSQHARADKRYRQALALEPDLVEAHRGLAALYLSQGEPEAARDEALTALRVAPDDYAALKTLALAYQALGSIQEALDVARQARDLAPPSQRAALETLIAELEEAQTR
jgi:tetratricopeptide (TPR) repeat protein